VVIGTDVVRLTDQIEFANVILLNKTDMMPPSVVDKIETVVKTLNPYVSLRLIRAIPLTDRNAKIYRTTYSKTPLENLINTGLFDFGQASMGAGWLQSLREESTIQISDGKGGMKTVPKPETLE
jgi:G3E family GTPase